jgi:hypothetical protein
MALEAAGCIAIELECVPAKVAAEITKRTKMMVFGMGSGPDTDGQFVFAEDLLGTNDGHVPRHAVTYASMMTDAVNHLRQYKDDVISGAYPTAKHSIIKSLPEEEFAGFMDAISDHTTIADAIKAAQSVAPSVKQDTLATATVSLPVVLCSFAVAAALLLISRK